MQSNLQQNRSYLHWTKCRGKMRNLYLTFYLCVFVFSALMEVVNLSVSVTKTSVTIMWEWQRKSEPVRVSRYEAVLRKDSDKQCMWVNEPFNIKSHSTVKKKKKVCLFFIRFVHVYFLTCRGVTQNCYAYFITFLQMQHTVSHLQLYLCGQMTSSTLSMTWCPTLSILLRCWLIMFLKASFKWRQISVSFTGPKTRFLSVVFLHCSVGYISL